MNNATIIALAKVVGTKETAAARNGLSIGRHEVDFMVRVRGTMNVGEDTEKTPTVSIPMKETLALFIRYCGITREAAMAILERAMTDALEQGPQGTGAVAEALPIIEETMAAIVNPMLARLPKTPVKGAVRTSLEFTEISEFAVA